jgi:transcriptional regulator with XRE-family HTH domain
VTETLTPEEDRAQFGDQLRKRLLRLNLTTTELADELGVTVRAVQGYLRGEYLPGPKIRRRIDRLYAELDRGKL